LGAKNQEYNTTQIKLQVNKKRKTEGAKAAERVILCNTAFPNKGERDLTQAISHFLDMKLKGKRSEKAGEVPSLRLISRNVKKNIDVARRKTGPPAPKRNVECSVGAFVLKKEVPS